MSDDAEAVREVVATWMAASKNGDVAAVLALMTDDVIFMVPGQEPFGKDVFARLSDGMGNMRLEGTSEILELQVLGHWAFVRNHIELQITPPAGEPIRRSGNTLTLLRKDADGQWRIARDANLLTVRR
ncbi:YybH family protein [Azospirillum sp.]|uniref:YybH family protein n=1 Tax=Azospirillum sp. TaxID=34012 RepID=UPI003D757308